MVSGLGALSSWAQGPAIAMRVPMMSAVCIRCGTIKKWPMDTCGRCAFIPTADEDKARSLILSTAYEIHGEYRGKSVEELEKIAADIRAAKPYSFDAHEVRSVTQYAHDVLSIPPRRVIMDAITWIGPPAAALVILFFLLTM
jgi:hypothetical protein